MNIKQAKEQIANTVKAYLAADEHGRYLIPQHKQRPVFLMGPPGVGKTEIMAQVAAELDIGLLSYSMTHHTRQSALGLPIIKEKEFEGEKFEASEYTVSEIISAVYDLMKRSGVRSGILFLDEINCVSETLTPVMLQFLQYKVFGGRTLPEGWVVVTAGNPPEYNSSVREFDIATRDRLKCIDVTPDLAVWKEFAHTAGIHGAVLTYLEIKPQNFYRIERTAAGRSFVTARGWDDLSRLIKVYEKLGIEVDKELVGQYLQDKHIAEDFAAYYDLYRKYQRDYRIYDILEGIQSKEITERAKKAGFDERYALLGLMLETVSRECAQVMAEDSDLIMLKHDIQEIQESDEPSAAFAEKAKALEDERERLRAANNLSKKKDDSLLYRCGMLKKLSASARDGIEEAKSQFRVCTDAFSKKTLTAKRYLNNMFVFCSDVFGTGQELLIVLTEVAADPNTTRFIGIYGCEEYYRYDKELMFHERRLEIIEELENLRDNGNKAY